MFCRNCGKELAGTPEICANCGANPVGAAAFCRFCGNTTNAQMIWCPKCGAALKVIVKPGEALSKKQSLFTVILKVVVVVAIISTYTYFTLPPRAVKTVKNTASDIVMASTGYTALPLHSISAYPPIIPPLGNIGEVFVARGISVNATQQLDIYAIYKNTIGDNATKATRLEEVTDRAVYKSSNEKVASVTAAGLVKGVAPGSVNITVSYTAIPGSANLTTAAEGKVPITVTVTVPVSVIR